MKVLRRAGYNFKYINGKYCFQHKFTFLLVYVSFSLFSDCSKIKFYNFTFFIENYKDGSTKHMQLNIKFSIYISHFYY